MPSPPRLVPDAPFPPYTFVPGRTPHPFSDPAGHRHGGDAAPPAAPDPARWAECRPYLLGLDLFNHGYYWEAHEAWEALWRAAGRKGRAAAFLKGLIKLAAAGVKAREGKPEGVRGHARRARELFAGVAEELATEGRYFGLDLANLMMTIGNVIDTPPAAKGQGAAVEVVFSFALLPLD
jgi:hypothetical protein